MRKSLSIGSAVAFFACLVNTPLLAADVFTGLGILPGGNSSFATEVSADGNVVVGGGTSSLGFQAFRWSATTGIQGLGDFPSGIFESSANGVSGDGSIVVGYGTTANGRAAFRWSVADQTMQPLGALDPSNPISIANDISADGSVIVGQSNSPAGQQAFRYTNAGGMEPLGFLSGGAFSYASGVSADGSVIAGGSRGMPDAHNDLHAYRWTSAEGMQSLGHLPGAVFGQSTALEISADGKTIVGQDLKTNSQPTSIYWTETEGMVAIDPDRGDNQAHSVSGDGSVIVGFDFFDRGGFGAFIWDSVNGFRSIQAILEAPPYNIDMSGWRLSEATDISEDGKVIVGHGTNPNGQTEAWIVNLRDNEPPTAVAGADQTIRAGETAQLDGSASFDDNTASGDLIYSWSFISKPVGSSADLSGADTAMPSFVADVPGTYVVDLIVTDEGGLSSTADSVAISSDNLAPTANAGDDKLVIVGTTVNLDGTGSTDPENDALTYAWSIASAPAGNNAQILNANSATASITPDALGSYEISLVVSDFIGPGASDTVSLTVVSAENFAVTQIVNADAVIENLGSGQVTTGGNQNALQNFLSQAAAAIGEGDISEAVFKLEQAIARTDGCIVNNPPAPDGNGPGRDWITDCTEQEAAYELLTDALIALQGS